MCVIGNPPYVRPEKVEEDERNYFIKSGHFDKFFGRFDIYVLFIERALKLLGQGSLFILHHPIVIFQSKLCESIKRMDAVGF